MNSLESDEQARSTADAVARRSYGKLVAFLVSRTRDLAAAEDALSEAFAAALSGAPHRHGCPSNPEAWLLTVARRKTIDHDQARRNAASRTPHLQLLAEGIAAAESGMDMPDHRLALMFVCAHPAIDASIRAPLILQVVLGLDAKAIAAAFVTSPAMSKRLVRAKGQDSRSRDSVSSPGARRASSAPRCRLERDLRGVCRGLGRSGRDRRRPTRSQRRGAVLGAARDGPLPREPEALGLLALMLHAEARRRARRDANGEYVSLAAQDPQPLGRGADR